MKSRMVDKEPICGFAISRSCLTSHYRIYPVYNAHFISREIDLQMYDAHNTRIPLFGQENKRRQKLYSNWCLINLVKIVHEVIVRRKIL